MYFISSYIYYNKLLHLSAVGTVVLVKINRVYVNAFGFSCVTVNTKAEAVLFISGMATTICLWCGQTAFHPTHSKAQWVRGKAYIFLLLLDALCLQTYSCGLIWGHIKSPQCRSNRRGLCLTSKFWVFVSIWKGHWFRLQQISVATNLLK